MNRFVLLAIGLAACASADNGAPVDGGAGSVDSPARRDAAIDATSLDATAANTCTSASTCSTAQMLGTVSGDTGAATLSADGYQAAWYRVRVTEDYSEEIGLALRLSAKLTIPAGSGFEAFVYVNAASDTVECNSTTGTVTTAGNVKEVRAEWGESIIPNGADDSRNVTIEVRPTGTSCAASQSWHLQLDGNWL